MVLVDVKDKLLVGYKYISILCWYLANTNKLNIPVRMPMFCSMNTLTDDLIDFFDISSRVELSSGNMSTKAM